jgi:uncharacterized protein with FMN-binding domain
MFKKIALLSITGIVCFMLIGCTDTKTENNISVDEQNNIVAHEESNQEEAKNDVNMTTDSKDEEEVSEDKDLTNEENQTTETKVDEESNIEQELKLNESESKVEEANDNKTANKYKDGVYEVTSKTYSESYAVAKITIKDDRVVEIEWKDSGKKAHEGIKQYISKYKEVQDLEEIDVVSGASVTYEIFNDVIEQALEQAEMK